MSLQNCIHERLTSALRPHFLEVINESGQHNVPPGSESHFKVTIVSEVFREKKMLARHREVYQLLSQEMASGVHALALHTMTPEEWEGTKSSQKSPPCLGGSKKESKTNS